MKKNNKKGFTLVELLVVIAILSILATVTVVGYLGFTQRAKESNATTELTQVRDVITAYTLEDGQYEYSDGSNNYVLSIADDKLAITKDEDIISTSADIKAAINAIPDLENLAKGEGQSFAIVDGNLEYTYEDGIVAVWNIANSTVEIKK